MSFSVSFAKPRDTLECDAPPTLQQEAGKPARCVGQRNTAMPLRLVLIEDHQALRDGLELLLGRQGCVVVGTAGTAAEGRALVDQLEPDVALVDIRLGEDDGIELTRELLDTDPERRIVLYTGSADEDLLFSGLDSGARGYALKDGSIGELVGALQTIAEGGTYVDPRLRPALLSRRSTRGAAPPAHPE